MFSVMLARSFLLIFLLVSVTVGAWSAEKEHGEKAESGANNQSPQAPIQSGDAKPAPDAAEPATVQGPDDPKRDEESAEKPAEQESAEAQQAEPKNDGNESDVKPKYNRRVLLMEFVNEQHDERTRYLSVSIPDAFSIPLIKTGNFIILNRSSVERYAQMMGVAKSSLLEVENAVRLGKAVGADVVVTGRFIATDSFVTIEAKAVDVQAGLLSVEDSEQIATNTTMFASIDKLAQRMSGPMAEKMKPLDMPPPPAEVILDETQLAEHLKLLEEKKAQQADAAEKAPEIPAVETAYERRLMLEPGMTFLQSPGVSGRQITYDGRYPLGAMSPGLFVSLTFQSTMPRWQILSLFQSFHFFASAEYARYSANLEVLSSTGQTLIESDTKRFQTIGAALSLAHPLSLWTFSVLPYAGFSMNYATFTASNSERLFQGLIPGAHLGVRWIIYELAGIEIGLNIRSGFHFLNDGNNYLTHTLVVSGGYRL